MSEYKYIVVEVETGMITRETPYIFPKDACHDHFFEAIQFMYMRHHPKSDAFTCLSAGFVTIMDSGPHCWGHSETLNISSRGDEDSHLIQMYDYGVGIR